MPSSILFEDDAAAGFENVKTVSLALPILKLLQNGSGEAQRRNQNYVEGAEPGMFLNIVFQDLLLNVEAFGSSFDLHSYPLTTSLRELGQWACPIPPKLSCIV